MIAGIAYLVLTQAKIVKPAPAIFADAATRNVVSACRKAFANLKSARFTITSGGETKRYTFSSGRVAAAQRGAQWTFDNRRFTIQNGKGLYRGRISPFSVNSWLTRAGAAPEVLPIHLIAHKNPVDALVAPGSRVRKVGVMTKGGVTADLVEIKSAGLRVSVAIRRDNHLFANLSADNMDARNRVLSSSSRSVAWSAINTAFPAQTFQLGGQTAQGLRNIH